MALGTKTSTPRPARRLLHARGARPRAADRAGSRADASAFSHRCAAWLMSPSTRCDAAAARLARWPRTPTSTPRSRRTRGACPRSRRSSNRSGREAAPVPGRRDARGEDGAAGPPAGGPCTGRRRLGRLRADLGRGTRRGRRAAARRLPERSTEVWRARTRRPNDWKDWKASWRAAGDWEGAVKPVQGVLEQNPANSTALKREVVNSRGKGARREAVIAALTKLTATLRSDRGAWQALAEAHAAAYRFSDVFCYEELTLFDPTAQHCAATRRALLLGGPRRRRRSASHSTESARLLRERLGTARLREAQPAGDGFIIDVLAIKLDVRGRKSDPDDELNAALGQLAASKLKAAYLDVDRCHCGSATTGRWPRTPPPVLPPPAKNRWR